MASTSLAMRRASPSVARIGPDPTLTRATPARASSATGGTPWKAITLNGRLSARTSRAIASRSAIPGSEEAVGAGLLVHPEAMECILEERRRVAAAAQVRVGARVDEQRHVRRGRDLADGSDLVHQEVRVFEPILDVDADAAGVDHRLDVRRHRGRRGGVAGFEVDAERNAHDARDVAHRAGDQIGGDRVAVGIAERIGQAGAGRRDRRRAGLLEDARAGGVPRVQQHQRRTGSMQLTEPLGALSLVGHLQSLLVSG